MEPQFAPALSRVQFLLSRAAREAKTPIRFALIGGLSLAAWGVVRATQDIDFLADSEPSPIGDVTLRNRLKTFLDRQRCHVEWRVGDYDDPVPLLLRIDLPRSYGGLGADIIWAHRRWHRDALERAIDVKLSRRRVPVLHPEDLILLKLDAGGPQDLADVEELLADPPPQLNVARLKETAARLRRGRALEKCLRRIQIK
jgi:Nucleotidyl transferase AbiEii toxin, Type IV TA system